MRLASEWLAKPPNTTEWMAPMRTQASMANAGLGNHGHVDQHAVALLDALRLQDGGHALHFGVQFAEAVGLLGSVSVDTKISAFWSAGPSGGGPPRCGTGWSAALEPAGKRRVVVVADPVKRLVPVHQLGLLGPESIAVGDRAR
jgi:hypothetical protein